MDKILILTDTHITAPPERIIGLDPAERLVQTLAAALTAHPDAAALVLMGDLTHHGRPAEYAVLRTLLDRAAALAPVPLIPMIGNHDRRDAFRAAFPAAPVTPQGHVQHVLDLPHHRLITLDTVDHPGTHAGALCADRLAWLDAALAGAGDRMALVCAHHPPFLTGIAGMDPIRLFDDGALLDRLRRHGRAHLFCGHLHLTVAGQTEGVPWTIFKGTCHQGVLDLVTPDSSLAVDEPATFGVVLLPPGAVIAHSEEVIDHGAPGHDAASG